ncbi:VCBS domain-containing protein [Halomonas sp. N3-2A]|uniref:VCBS domain-containing protein n=1 Tax=Halomonas sp. N3-2A TaxID=2014541 RepID=UPI0012FE749D|nr:VCBS domain-containing protein [Halomonas sp. N3-2A]
MTSTNVPAAEATETDGTLVIDGEYGTLTINADGSYTYTLDNANLTVQDSEGNVVNATATVGADGSYTTTEDLSSLVDGEITVDASAEDRNGNPVSDSDSGELDATAGTLDVTLGDLWRPR